MHLPCAGSCDFSSTTSVLCASECLSHAECSGDPYACVPASGMRIEPWLQRTKWFLSKCPCPPPCGPYLRQSQLASSPAPCCRIAKPLDVRLREAASCFFDSALGSSLAPYSIASLPPRFLASISARYFGSFHRAYARSYESA